MNRGPRTRVILLVDDDPGDQWMIRRAIEESPVESRLRVVNDGMEALDYLRREGEGADPEAFPMPDLVLVDLNMPVVSGREVVRTLRADPRFENLPIVVFTTSRDPGEVAELYRLGCNSYVVKPTSFDELCRVLDTVQQYWFRVVELPTAG